MGKGHQEGLRRQREVSRLRKCRPARPPIAAPDARSERTRFYTGEGRRAGGMVSNRAERPSQWVGGGMRARTAGAARRRAPGSPSRPGPGPLRRTASSASPVEWNAAGCSHSFCSSEQRRPLPLLTRGDAPQWGRRQRRQTGHQARGAHHEPVAACVAGKVADRAERIRKCAHLLRPNPEAVPQDLVKIIDLAQHEYSQRGWA